jgi:DNA-binding NtrC family response regulator
MLKILVVDDEKMIANALQRVLAKAGHKVFTSHNGLDAIAIIENESIDLIFLDLLMPEMNGSDLMEWLHAQRPNIKFIVMTAYGDQATKDELTKKGALQVLAKPFDDIFSIPKLIEKFF